MAIQNFMEEKEKGFPESLYVLTYSDDFFVHHALDILRKNKPPKPPFTLEVLDLAEKRPPNFFPDLISQLNTPALFSPNMYVVIKNFQKILKKDLQTFNDYMKNPCQISTVFLFLQSSGKKAKSLDIKGGKKIELTIKKGELSAWLEQRAQIRGFSLSKDGINYFKEFFDENLSLLDNELEKLSLLGLNKVTAKTIIESFHGTRAVSAFALPEAIIKGRKKLALQLYAQSAETTEKLMILGSLNWKLGEYAKSSAIAGKNSLELFEKLMEGELNLKQTAMAYPLELLLIELSDNFT